MSNSIYQVGKICTIDKDNKYFKQTESGVIFVEIVEVIPKKGLFGKETYMVKGAGDDEPKLPVPIQVSREMLHPEGMAVIRYPDGIPVVNSQDIRALKIILGHIESPKSTFVDNSDPKLSIRNRLYALLSKLEFYASNNEV